MSSNGNISVIRSSQPRRVTPAFARIMPSHSDESNFFILVFRFPRISTICKSGRTLSSWHFRRRLPVAMTAFAGRSRNVRCDFFELTMKTSCTSSLSSTAAMARPSGTKVGTSLKLCTAISTRSSSKAISSSLVKRPLSPIFASGAS